MSKSSPTGFIRAPPMKTFTFTRIFKNRPNPHNNLQPIPKLPAQTPSYPEPEVRQQRPVTGAQNKQEGTRKWPPINRSTQTGSTPKKADPKPQPDAPPFASTHSSTA